MRKPSFKTVEDNLIHYCRLRSMQLWNHGDGTYSVYDTKTFPHPNLGKFTNTNNHGVGFIKGEVILNRVDRRRVAIEVYACFNNC